MKRVALVLPWVGKRPVYWRLWQRSAAARCFDVVVVEKPLSEFSRLIQEKLGPYFPHGSSQTVLRTGYKLCDLKPMYGLLFENLLKGYDYWAFGDCDVLYGRAFDEWIEKAVAAEAEIATVQSEYCAGPFTLVRNTETCNRLFLGVGNWQEMLMRPQVTAFDELGENWFRKRVYGGMSYEALRRSQNSFSALCWREAAAGRLRLIHEEVICEVPLHGSRVQIEPDGRLVVGGREQMLYHFIGEKNRFGFVCDESGIWISRGLPFLRDLVHFSLRLLCGNCRAWRRLSECLQRKVGLRLWQRQLPWNNC